MLSSTLCTVWYGMHTEGQENLREYKGGPSVSGLLSVKFDLQMF